VDKFVIRGGRKLQGEVRVSGAKNAALPLLASSLLCDGWNTYHNIPDLVDIKTIRSSSGNLGATIDGGETLRINTGNIKRCEAPYNLVRTMRASVLVLGPLVARWVRRGYPFRVGARSGQGLSTFTSRPFKNLGAESNCAMATSRRRPPG